jgi:predicted outer membrane protein
MAEMKSAVELAMEKLGKLKTDTSSESLTDEQRQRIGDLRKQYDAKIAEKEIMMQAEIRKLMQRYPPQEVAVAAQGLRQQFQETKRTLQQELEDKIAAIRTRH